jgi:hypothetical protein
MPVVRKQALLTRPREAAAVPVPASLRAPTDMRAALTMSIPSQAHVTPRVNNSFSEFMTVMSLIRMNNCGGMALASRRLPLLSVKLLGREEKPHVTLDRILLPPESAQN